MKFWQITSKCNLSAAKSALKQQVVVAVSDLCLCLKDQETTASIFRI
jgi:hypothetical protein